MAIKIPVPSSLATLDISPSTTTTTTTTNTTHPSTILTSHTLPPPTRKTLLTHLQLTSSIPPLNHLLTTALHQHTTTHPPGAADWTSRLSALALELLRSGACHATFHDLMNEITRRALMGAVEDGGDAAAGGGRADDDDDVGRRRGGVGTIVLPDGSCGVDGLPDVRIPAEVVGRAVAFLERRVRDHVVLKGDGD